MREVFQIYIPATASIYLSVHDIYREFSLVDYFIVLDLDLVDAVIYTRQRKIEYILIRSIRFHSRFIAIP